MTQVQQPEALRLAAWLREGAWHEMRLGDVQAAGRELRRLHARVQELEARLLPPGWQAVPVKCPTAICCAIEREIDEQLAASGITAPMHRQDGALVWAEALSSAPRFQ